MKGGLLDTCDTWDTCVILIKTFIFTKLLFLVKDKSYCPNSEHLSKLLSLDSIIPCRHSTTIYYYYYIVSVLFRT